MRRGDEWRILIVRPTSRKLSIDLRGVEGTFWVWQGIGAPWLPRVANSEEEGDIWTKQKDVCAFRCFDYAYISSRKQWSSEVQDINCVVECLAQVSINIDRKAVDEGDLQPARVQPPE